MAVYVDPLMNYGGSATFRWTHSCHMFADTVDELHQFAQRIGLKRQWFQLSKSGLFPHYDLNPSRRVAAVKAGAIEMDRREAYNKWQELGFLRKKEKAPVEPQIEVINCKHYEGKPLPHGFKIDRSTPLGNPWSHIFGLPNTIYVKTRAEAVAHYRGWLLQQMQSDTQARRYILRLFGELQKTGKLVLICHCVPLECHGTAVKQLLLKMMERKKKTA